MPIKYIIPDQPVKESESLKLFIKLHYTKGNKPGLELFEKHKEWTDILWKENKLLTLTQNTL